MTRRARLASLGAAAITAVALPLAAAGAADAADGPASARVQNPGDCGYLDIGYNAHWSNCTDDYQEVLIQVAYEGRHTICTPPHELTMLGSTYVVTNAWATGDTCSPEDV